MTGASHLPLSRLVFSIIFAMVMAVPLGVVIVGDGPGAEVGTADGGPMVGADAPLPGAPAPTGDPAPASTNGEPEASTGSAPRSSSRIPVGEADDTGGSWMDNFFDPGGIDTFSNITVMDGSVKMGGYFQQIDNPSFEDAIAGEWYYNETNSTYVGGRSTDWSSDGDHSYHLRSGSNHIHDNDYCSISQDFDLTAINKLTFDYKAVTTGGWSMFRYRMYVDDDMLYSKDQSNDENKVYKDISVDLSDYTGVHTLQFRLQSRRDSNNAVTRNLYIDNIRTEGIPISFKEEGWVVSNYVSLAEGANWDTFSLGKTEPTHSQISVTILDGLSGTPLDDFMNKGGTEFDISGIDPEEHPSLRFKAWMQGNGTNTPSLDWWGISYNASHAWRDSFMGSSKFAAEEDDVDVMEGSAGLELIKGANLAEGKTVTASSEESGSYPAENAVDGDKQTRWASLYSDDQWLQVDLGNKRAISLVIIHWEEAFGKWYKVQGSDDAAQWTELADVTAGDGEEDYLQFSRIQVRYVRMKGMLRGTQWGYSIFELEIYDQYYAPSDALVSQTITPPPNRRYERLNFDLDVQTGTSAWVSIVDGATDKAIGGYDNVTATGTSLMDIDPSAHPSVKLRLDFASDGRYTPLINTWSVTWTDDEPVLVALIPDGAMKEDVEVDNLYDLGLYFNDSYTSDDDLKYTVNYEPPVRPVEAKINFERYLGVKITEKNWNGYLYLSINASDGEFSAGSNVFMIEVLPVNDPPVWDDIPPVNFTEDGGKQLVANLLGNITDVDTEDTGLGFVVVSNTDDNFEFSIVNESGNLWVDYPPDFFGQTEVMVRVNDSNNERDTKITVTVLPVNDRPTIGLVAPANGTGQTSENVTLEWTGADDVDSTAFTYDLYFGPDSRAVARREASMLYKAKIADTSYTVGPLATGTYYWTVVPHDGYTYGNSLDGWFSFDVDVSQDKPIVDLVFPPDGAVLAAEPAVLRWTPTFDRPEFLTYDIYLSPNGTADSLWARNVQGTSYGASGLTAGVTYTWKVLPHNGSFYGPCRSGEWTLTFDTSQWDKIPRVSLLEPASSATITEDSVTLSWGLDGPAPTSGVEFQAFLGRDPGSMTDLVHDPAATSATVTDLADGATYSWTVLPVTGDGIVGECLDGIRTFKVQLPVTTYRLRLTVPELVTVEQGSSIQTTITVENRGNLNDTVRLTWDTSALAGFVEVAIDGEPIPSGHNLTIATGGTSGMTVTIDVPAAGVPGSLSPATYAIMFTAHSLGADSAGLNIETSSQLAVTVTQQTVDVVPDDKSGDETSTIMGLQKSVFWLLIVVIIAVVAAAAAAGLVVAKKKKKRGAVEEPLLQEVPTPPPLGEGAYSDVDGAYPPLSGDAPPEQLEGDLFGDEYLTGGGEDLKMLPGGPAVLDVETSRRGAREAGGEGDDGLDDDPLAPVPGLGVKLPTDYEGPEGPGGELDAEYEEYDDDGLLEDEGGDGEAAEEGGDLDIVLPEDVDDELGEMPGDDELLDDVGEPQEDDELLGDVADEDELLSESVGDAGGEESGPDDEAAAGAAAGTAAAGVAEGKKPPSGKKRPSKKRRPSGKGPSTGEERPSKKRTPSGREPSTGEEPPSGEKTPGGKRTAVKRVGVKRPGGKAGSKRPPLKKRARPPAGEGEGAGEKAPEEEGTAGEAKKRPAPGFRAKPPRRAGVKGKDGKERRSGAPGKKRPSVKKKPPEEPPAGEGGEPAEAPSPVPKKVIKKVKRKVKAK